MIRHSGLEPIEKKLWNTVRSRDFDLILVLIILHTRRILSQDPGYIWFLSPTKTSPLRVVAQLCLLTLLGNDGENNVIWVTWTEVDMVNTSEYLLIPRFGQNRYVSGINIEAKVERGDTKGLKKRDCSLTSLEPHVWKCPLPVYHHHWFLWRASHQGGPQR